MLALRGLLKILHVKPQHCHGLVPTHTALGVPSWEPVPPDFTPLGLFGTGIQSYFTFLRFLLLLNLLTLLMTASFVLLPLVWLRHPEPGPALKLSECWNCPDPCAPQPGHAAWASLGLFCTSSLSVRQVQWSWKVECHVCLGDPVLLVPSSYSAGLPCSGSHPSQSGIPKFHNPLWNILTGKVSGVSTVYVTVLQSIWETLVRKDS